MSPITPDLRIGTWANLMLAFRRMYWCDDLEWKDDVGAKAWQKTEEFNCCDAPSGEEFGGLSRRRRAAARLYLAILKAAVIIIYGDVNAAYLFIIGCSGMIIGVTSTFLVVLLRFGCHF